MDFFGMQDEARRRTRRLVILFVLAVIGIAAGIYAVLVLADVLLGTGATTGDFEGGTPRAWSPARFFLTLAIVAAVVGGGTAFKLAQYRGGGGVVARSLGGRLVDRMKARGDERRLVNVIEEMALAAGTPVPEIYILDDETAINAFAAGYAPGDAAIGVTKGCLEQLNRDELQGVIAHEFSHILNGDMRLNLRMAGVIFGILVLSIVGRGMLRSIYFSGGSRRRRDGDNKGVIVILVLAFALILLGLIGQLFGRLIQAAISRQREFLADASAVQFTRNPGGIAGALKSIGAHAQRGKVGNAAASGLAHLFFADALHKGFSAAFATHPPLEQRIRRIEPSWDGSFDASRKPAPAKASAPARSTSDDGVTGASAGERMITAATLLASIGTLSSQAMTRARIGLRKMPEEVRSAFESPEGCLATLLVLFADEQSDQREKQLAVIRPRMSKDVIERFHRLLPRIRQMVELDAVALGELAVSGLRGAPPDEIPVVLETLRMMVEVDKRHSLREFCLLALVRSRLQQGKQNTAVTMETGEAMAALLGAIRTPPQDYAALAPALDTLRTAPLSKRRDFITAALREIVKDNEITAAESELIRTLSIALDIPLGL